MFRASLSQRVSLSPLICLLALTILTLGHQTPTDPIICAAIVGMPLFRVYVLPPELTPSRWKVCRQTRPAQSAKNFVCGVSCKRRPGISLPEHINLPHSRNFQTCRIRKVVFDRLAVLAASPRSDTGCGANPGACLQMKSY